MKKQGRFKFVSAGIATAAVILGFGASAASAAPVAELAPGSHAFGQQLVGTESSNFEFTLSNTGDGSISVGSISKAGSNPGQFKIKAGSSCEANVTVLDNVLPSCTIRVTFDPGSTGNKTAAIEVVTDLSPTPLSVTVTGQGINPPAPRALISSTVIPFYDQVVGAGPSIPRTVILTSTGSLPLEVGDISVAGSVEDFPTDVLTCENRTFQPGESCTFTASFQPREPGLKKNVITILTNASATPIVIRMAGTGIAPPSEGTAGLKLAGKLPRVNGARLRLPVTCSVESMDRCAGRVKVFAKRSVLGRKTLRKVNQQIAGGQFAVRKGRKVLTVKLNRIARKALSRRGSLPVTIETRVRQADGSLEIRRTTRKIRTRG